LIQNNHTLNSGNKKTDHLNTHYRKSFSTKNNLQTKLAINHKNFMELIFIKIKIVFDKNQETTKLIQLSIKS